MPHYVFVLSPPYAGSTVLSKLIGTSELVSALPGEGQHLPTVRPVMEPDAWNEARTLPWPFIKEAWERYWDLEKDVLLEKSPPNMLRAAAMAEVFDPAYFVVLVRDPYATTEGVMRRWNWDAAQAAEFVLRLLARQRENLETLPNTMRVTYEELVSDAAGVARRIEAFVPGLSGIKPDHKFRVHAIDGLRRRGIVDLNARKFVNLRPRDVETITGVLERDPELLEFWGYSPRPPRPLHGVRYAISRTRLFLTAPVRARIVAFATVVRWTRRRLRPED